MNFEDALRLTQILLGIALAQQSIEHLHGNRIEKGLFTPRLILALMLIAGYQVTIVLVLLFMSSLVNLWRFQGPYNGGADRMGLLILTCLSFATLMPSRYLQEIALGYLAVQLVLSYFMSGWVKIVNPEWRNGRALTDVFQFSAYPASESLRGWSQSPRLLLCMSWCVIVFELLFPLALISHITLIAALILAACFHFTNACLFGLNRFFWTWIAAYPSIIWLQMRLINTAS